MEGSKAAEEEEIIRRVLAGSKEEFSALVLRYQNQVYGMIMRQVADPDVAKELAQEVFLRAYQNLAKFEHRSSFGTWITRIALNRASSYFSSREHRQKKQTTSMDNEEHIVNLHTEESTADKEASLRTLRARVAELPEKLRDAVVLCTFENKSYQEAAAILEIPVGTVSSRLNRGMCLLREALKGAES